MEREIKAWNQKDKKSKSTKGFTYNSEALIRACEKNNFKMVKHFLEICFCDGKIKFTLHVDKFEESLKEEKFSCKEWFYDNTKMLSGEFQQYTSGFLNFFRIFYARSTPAYLVARFQFSDEKGFSVSLKDGRLYVYRFENERYEDNTIIETINRGYGSVNVWGSIIGTHKLPLVRIDKPLTSEKYIQTVLTPHVLPFIRNQINANHEKNHIPG